MTTSYLLTSTYLIAENIAKAKGWERLRQNVYFNPAKGETIHALTEPHHLRGRAKDSMLYLGHNYYLKFDWDDIRVFPHELIFT